MKKHNMIEINKKIYGQDVKSPYITDLGGQNFQVMILGLNLAFIGKEIYTHLLTKQFG